VSGASSGLGARFATVLADAGAQVVACARRVEPIAELAAERPRIHPQRCDVTSAEDREALLAATLERFGRVDVCVNNAGIASGGRRRQATLEAFRETMRVNVEALFAISQLVGERMREQRSGSLINVSSVFSHVSAARVPDAGYAASKAAVNGLTRELALHWARDGVRVNAIAPGWFPSEMTQKLMEHPELRSWLETNCPMGRVGRIDELDGALLFLATEASSFCTGQVLTIDGGWTLQ